MKTRTHGAWCLALGALLWTVPGCEGSFEATLPRDEVPPPTGPIGTQNNRPIQDPPKDPPKDPPMDPPVELMRCLGEPDVGPSQMRRLTRQEYQRTASALLGTSTQVIDMLPADNRARGFDNQAEVQEASATHIQAWQEAAEALTAGAKEAGVRLASCDITGDGRACFETFLDDFGTRAFRRPLTASERTRYTSFFAASSQTSGPERALELVTQAMLMSPNFLYLVEEGQEDTPTKLDGYALASRLSYLLWNTSPDAALLEAAGTGELETMEGLERHARRLLEDPQAQGVVRDFYLQWSDMSALDNLEAPPGFDEDELKRGVRLEIERYIDHWYAGGNVLSDLLLDPTTFVNEELARDYRIDGVTGRQVRQARLDDTKYAGLLTRAAFVGTHPIPPNRGDFVLNKVLCIKIQVPPLEIPLPPESEEFETRRERFEAHADQDCARACHGILDPVGFAFEHFDDYGRWQDMDNGVPVDASTVLALSMEELQGPIDGAIDLSRVIGESEQLELCHSEQWFTYAYHRAPARNGDDCSKYQLEQALATSGGKVEELLVQLVLTDAFRYVRKKEVTP